MTDDAADLVRDLEARITRLEERLLRLEGAAEVSPDPEVPSAMIIPAFATTQAAATPIPGPGPAPAPAPVPPAQTYWQIPGAPRPPREAASTSAPGALWPDRRIAGAGSQGFGAPSSSALRLPDLTGSFSDIEQRLAGRALAWVGGLALVLGAIFFLSLAFSRGWIGPELRVVIGMFAGAVSLAIGGVVLARGNRLIGHVLTPVGLAIISISMVGATRLFDLVPVPIGLLVVLVSAIVVAAIAVRFDAPIVAAFGLVAVLAAPPLLGAEPDATTLAFVAATLVGTTAVALWRTWAWLPPIAFLLAAPQVASWILGDPGVVAGLLGVSLFWVLNVVAAGGEEFRRRRQDLSPSSAGLLLASAAFFVWAGFVLLNGPLEDLRALFLVGVAAAHFVVGGAFLRRDGDQSLFGLLAAATGVAALTMAAPIQLGAPLFPIAWTAEAVVLTWIAVERRHRLSGYAAAVLYGLAGSAIPWVTFISDLPVATLVFFALGVAAGVWTLRTTVYAGSLAAWGLIVAGTSIALGLEGLEAVATLAAVIVVGFAVDRWLGDTRSDRSAADDPWLVLTSMAVGVLAAIRLVSSELPISAFQDQAIPLSPFPVAGLAGAAILIAATIAAGVIHRHTMALRVGFLVAGAIATYTIPFLVPSWAVAEAWAALAMGAVATELVPRLRHVVFRMAAYGLLLAATAVALAVAPPSRLVDAEAIVAMPVIVESMLALATCVAVGVVLARTEREPTLAAWTWVAVGIGFVYTASVVVVDLVVLATGETLVAEERQTIAQTALTLLWAVLGIAAFVVGLARRSTPLRQAGLVLLAVTTVKVFLFDLASLDVAYRVVSLVGLGVILLAGAWLWQRTQPKAESSVPGPDG